jgi:phage tail tube protein FII
MAGLRFLNVRGGNIFAADINVGLPLSSWRLPMLAESMDSFAPAGVRGSIDLPTGADAPELMFNTKGIQPDLIRQFAIGFGQRRTYTLLGALVDELAENEAQRAIPVEATVIGRISSIDFDEYEGQSLAGSQYIVKSIPRLQIKIGGTVCARFDLQNGGWLDEGGLQISIAQTIGLNA